MKQNYRNIAINMNVYGGKSLCSGGKKKTWLFLDRYLTFGYSWPWWQGWR